MVLERKVNAMPKTVLITGADRGVGFALCEYFLKGGWQVIAGQYMPDWPQLSQLSRQEPENLHIIPLNVSDTESVNRAAKACAALCSTIDLLISCAGISGNEEYDNMRAVFNVNTIAALRVTEAFLPLMQGGLKRLAIFQVKPALFQLHIGRIHFPTPCQKLRSIWWCAGCFARCARRGIPSDYTIRAGYDLI